jgi:hypothetical protein
MDLQMVIINSDNCSILNLSRYNKQITNIKKHNILVSRHYKKGIKTSQNINLAASAFPCHPQKINLDEYAALHSVINTIRHPTNINAAPLFAAKIHLDIQSSSFYAFTQKKQCLINTRFVNYPEPGYYIDENFQKNSLIFTCGSVHAVPLCLPFRDINNIHGQICRKKEARKLLFKPLDIDVNSITFDGKRCRLQCKSRI